MCNNNDCITSCDSSTSTSKDINKKVSLIAVDNGLCLYQICLFATASVLGVAYILKRRVRLARAEVSGAVVFGLLNIAVTAFLMLALGAMPVAVVLPTAHSSRVILNLLLGIIIWQERPLVRQYVGCLAAIAVILLVVMG